MECSREILLVPLERTSGKLAFQHFRKPAHGAESSDSFLTFSSRFSRYVLTGFGFFTEGYTLFSISNLNALFVLVWPTCYSTFAVCSENWIAAQAYLQIIGIMVGQVVVGLEGDWVGRKFGLVQVCFCGQLSCLWG